MRPMSRMAKFGAKPPMTEPMTSRAVVAQNSGRVGNER